MRTCCFQHLGNASRPSTTPSQRPFLRVSLHSSSNSKRRNRQTARFEWLALILWRRSPNGDRWLLSRDPDTGRVFVRHEPNLPSGGQVATLSSEPFSSRLAADQRSKNPAPDWNAGLGVSLRSRDVPSIWKDRSKFQVIPKIRLLSGEDSKSRCFLATSIVRREHAWNRQWIV
jgi:hypothetical protein